MGMRSLLVLATSIMVCVGAPVVGAQRLSDLLEEGIYNQETTGDLDAALEKFSQIEREAVAVRRIAAEALYRMGEYYLTKGDNAAASAQFEKVLSQYGDDRLATAKARRQLASKAKKRPATRPVVLRTVPPTLTDIVLGLNVGADDYITKPFSINELMARSRAFLRRRRWEHRQSHQFGRFKLDLEGHRLMGPDGEVVLAPKEFDVLALFLTQRGRAITRDEILRTVWGRDVFVTARSVDRCVNILRKKIEADPARPQFILTIRQVGYRFAFKGTMD